jgi:hypothetical protein
MRIVGIGVCGSGEADRYMRKTMEEYKRLCDEVLIVTCNATEKEKELIKEYGFSQYEDNREWGKEQPNIKQALLERAGTLKPDWIITLDMDEVFAPEFTREEAEKLAKTEEIGYYFMIVNLYNDEQHFAHDKGIQRFWNVRYFKYTPEYGLLYQRTGVHCGSCPKVNWAYGWYAPFYVLHYGLMKPEDRQKKIERYQVYDPKRILKPAYYDDLERELKMHVFDAPGLLNKLREAKECQPRKTPKIKV